MEYPNLWGLPWIDIVVTCAFATCAVVGASFCALSLVVDFAVTAVALHVCVAASYTGAVVVVGVGFGWIWFPDVAGVGGVGIGRSRIVRVGARVLVVVVWSCRGCLGVLTTVGVGGDGIGWSWMELVGSKLAVGMRLSVALDVLALSVGGRIWLEKVGIVGGVGACRRWFSLV